MANSFVEYTANGSTNQFDITFSYIDRTHIKVFINNVEDTNFTFINDNRIQTSSMPSNGQVVKVDRDTPTTARLVDFQDGSVLTETDLDKSANQNFFIAQETEDEVASKLGQNNAGVFDAISKRIINVANPTSDQDAATKHYLENTWLSASDKTTITNLNNNISNINAVNSNSSNINTVAGSNTNINTVASNINSVNTVATNITDVVAVANDLAEAVSEVETVANDLNEATSEIDTVATNIANVNTVGTNIANVNTVAGSNTNINTVAGNNTNINTVAGISSDVTSVAGISSNVTSVANISSDVTSLANSLEKTYVVTVANVGGTNVFVLDSVNNPAIEMFRGNKYIFNVSDSSVSGHPLAFKDGSGNSFTTGVTTSGTAGTSGATVTFEVPSNAPNSMRYYCTSHGNAMGNTISVSDSNISLVASNVANINTVAGNNANINTVAGANSNITSVAGNISNVNSVASNASNINAVASNSANINTVAGAATNINTVASNVSGVNSFADRYRIASSAPTSSLDVGDLYFDTTANELKVYKSSGWAAAGSTVNGTSQRFKYTISGTPTTVSGADDNGSTLGYDAGFVDVYLNGVKMVNGTDVTVTSGTSIVFANALANGDIVDIVAFGTFDVAAINATNLNSGTIPDARFPATLPAISGANLTNLDASDLASGTVPIARLGSSGTKDSTTFLRGDNTFATVTSTTINNNADNRLITGSGTANTLEGEANLVFDGTNLGLGETSPSAQLHIKGSDITDQVIIENTNSGAETAPDLTLYRSSSSAADNDTLANIIFRGKNDAAEDVNYFEMTGVIADASDGSEDTQVEFSGKNGGSNHTFMKFIAGGIIESGSSIIPSTNNAVDLGSSSKVWRNIYTSDFHMSNENLDKGNDVDGTKGSWTFQEGEENLYLINNKNGKKYKFNLTEIE